MTQNPILPEKGTFLGRASLPDHAYPRVITVREDGVYDITSRTAPTVRDICEMSDPAGYVAEAPGELIGSRQLFIDNSWSTAQDTAKPYLLSPVDLQAIKAAGVTFVVSLLERVIEEQARGDSDKAEELRAEIIAVIGAELHHLVPGSDAAMEVKKALIARGLWSQYLEVGIGPDAEVFTKCQPMASVGYGADIGLHPQSHWNNPEPEIAVVTASDGRIVGATLGNDVNLRDFEGRSALLLGKAKDNNASASLGPFVRLFDAEFTIETVEQAEISLVVEGRDGFELHGTSSMSEISRSPEALVAAALGSHHQYPDGMVLYLGTMFAPTKDRGAEGHGFHHELGDVVSISTPSLGTLANTVRLSTECPPWTYGASHLMRDLGKAGLL